LPTWDPLFFILFISLSIQSFAKEYGEADLLAVADEHPLLQYRENGENKGPTIEILDVILKEAALSANISFMPWARAFAKAKSTSNTLILSMIRTPEREGDFYWLIKVSQLARVFISLDKTPENYVINIEEAKKKLVAVVRDSADHKRLTLMGFSEKHNLYVVPSDEQMHSLFINGRVDLIYGDPNSIQKFLDINGNAKVGIRYNKIESKDKRTSYIALSKKSDKEIVIKLQQAANKFVQTTEYLRLLAK